MNEIIKAITLIGFVQGYFIGSILLTRKNNHLANRILAILIIMMSTEIGLRYILMFNKMFSISIYFLYILLLSFFFGPLIYLYSMILLSKIKKIGLRQLFHFISLIIALVSITVFIIYYKGKFLDSFPPPFELRIFVSVVLTYGLSINLVYTVISISILKKHERSVQSYYSNMEKLTLHWLQRLLSLFLVLFIISSIIKWSRFFVHLPFKTHPFLVLFSLLGMIIIIFMTSYYTLNQPDIFVQTMIMTENLEIRDAEEMDNTDENQSKPAKYKKHSLDMKKQEKHLEQLLEYMRSQKPYLDESITIKDLADHLNISSHHLSMIINAKLNQNFYTFINEYRIKEVQSKLANLKTSNRNILEIAYESGFNSKTTFNTFFKKYTGKTPTEFRNSI